MSQVDIAQVAKDSGMDQLTAKQYLQAEVFPKLEVALNSVSQFTLTPGFSYSRLSRKMENSKSTLRCWPSARNGNGRPFASVTVSANDCSTATPRSVRRARSLKRSSVTGQQATATTSSATTS